MRILVVGSINRDLVLSVTNAPQDGETVFAHDLSYFAGGKGANQAVACARLGAYTAMVGCIGGDDNGRLMLQSLRDARIDTRFLLASSYPTGMATIIVDEQGQNRILVYRGANNRVTPDMVKEALTLHWDAMLLQWELPLETVFAAVELAAAKDIPVIMDPAPAQPLAQLSLPKGITVLTPNEQEAQTLTGLPMTTAVEAEQVLYALAAHAPIVLLKMGAGGALLYHEGVVSHYPAQAVTAIDTTGAGDAFTAAFAVKYGQTKDLDTAITFANCAGALCIQRQGGQPSMPKLSEVTALYDACEAL